MRSPVLMRALEEAYRGLLLSREYPLAILFLDYPPELVDVNIHPQKAEVKFQDAGEVYRVLYHAVKINWRTILIGWAMGQEGKLQGWIVPCRICLCRSAPAR